MAQDKFTQGDAFISFQIQLRRKEQDDFRLEVAQLEEKKQRQIEVNRQLKAEQMKHVKRLLNEVKEQERKLEQEEVRSKEQLEQALDRNLQLASDQERQLAELRNDLASLQQQLQVLQAEKQVWYNYKMVGSKEHEQQIRRLESELVIMQESFQQMSGSIQCSRDKALGEIDRKTTKLMDEKRSLAAERAIKELDSVSQWEIKDNEWLKREHAIYKEEVSMLELAVQQLEQDNLELVREMLQSRISGLQIDRNTFLTQDMGLALSSSGTRIETEDMLGLTEQSEMPGRPENAPGQAAEAGKVLSRPVDLEGDETAGSCTQSPQRPTGPTPWDPHIPLDDSQSIMQQKSLHLELVVVGQAAPLHPPLTDAIASATGLQEEWPLTTSIIHSRFK
ncbi:coiled-coil domain-containing protein 83 isoform X2 [Scleropages formosus]|uniref:coiled-coil domain-containing protein 83 isoform X2 n=1 Tax=Scleropages formosus TaxID=113540 RepID=UPI000878398D|nr:coiled-coil domain-containing protein 83 isoform X2 [Scleropages formosus]